MSILVTCQQIWFEDCDFEARGTEPEVTSELIDHVRGVHGIQLPERIIGQPGAELPDPERMVWARIQNAVDEPLQSH